MDARDYCGATKKPEVIAIFTQELTANMFNGNTSLYGICYLVGLFSLQPGKI